MKKLILILAFVFLFSFVSGQVVQGPSFQGNTQAGFNGGGSFASTTVQHAVPGYGVSPREVGVNQFFGLDPSQAYEYCQERQDFLIQIAPGGCTPTVVRSDLLAEQNVPVFCELQAIQINPTLDTSSIQNIVLTSEGLQSPAVVGVSYQRPNSGLRKYNSNQGFAAIDNLGYAIILMKGGMPENQMPDFVNGTLRARVQYDAVNAFGFGLQEDVLRVLSEEEWQSNYVKYGFFDGQAYVRLEKVDGNKATVGIYADADHRIDSFVVEKGKTSAEKYLAASYCNAGYSVSYLEGRRPQVKASFVLGADSYDVYEKEIFADGLCQVIKITPNGVGGSVSVKCGKEKPFTLKLNSKPVTLNVSGEIKQISVGESIGDSGGENSVYFVGIGEYSKDSGKEGMFALFTLTDKFEGDYSSFMKKIVSGEGINNFEATDLGNESNVFGIDVEFVSFQSLEDKEGDRTFEEYFDNAIDYYQEVEDIYDGQESSKIDGEFAGEKALKKAIELSGHVNKDFTKSELIEQINEKYEGNDFSGSLESARVLDREESSIKLVDFDSGKIVVEAKCKDNQNNGGKLEINLGSTRTVCEHKVGVEEINFEQEVKINLFNTYFML